MTSRLAEAAPGTLLARVQASEEYRRDDPRRQRNTDRLFAALDTLGTRVQPDELVAAVIRASATIDTEEKAKTYIIDFLAGSGGFYRFDPTVGLFVVEDGFELSPEDLAELDALGDAETRPVPEPSPEPASPVAADSEPGWKTGKRRPKVPTPVTPDSGWHWDGSKPLDSAREWSLAVMGCRHVSPTARRVASLYREIGHMTNGEAFVTAKTAERFLGIGRKEFQDARSKLREAGWITDTGRVADQTPWYAFTAPRCGCVIEPNPLRKTVGGGENTPHLEVRAA